jgi:hypothetical protein
MIDMGKYPTHHYRLWNIFYITYKIKYNQRIAGSCLIIFYEI